MWDEGIPLVLSEKQFKLIKGMETFLIRDGGECVIWVLTLEIENELSVGVVCAIVLDASFSQKCSQLAALTRLPDHE